MRKRVWGGLVLLLGVGAGLLIGWFVWPATPVDAPPALLRADWKDEAVWMAAQAYAYDRNLTDAIARLQPLGEDDLGRLVLDRAERALAANWPQREITYLARLAAALGARSPQVDPYLTP
jgi:hypothetical protein